MPVAQNAPHAAKNGQFMTFHVDFHRIHRIPRRNDGVSHGGISGNVQFDRARRFPQGHGVELTGLRHIADTNIILELPVDGRIGVKGQMRLFLAA